MLTIIFLDDNKEPVTISFTKNESISSAITLGYWNTDTNEVQLGSAGWYILQCNRNNVRALKYMMDGLTKIPITINRLTTTLNG